MMSLARCTSERERQLLRVSWNYNTYATHKDGRRVLFSVSYRHTIRPEFGWATVDAEGRVVTGYGHPKRNGFTKANGWTVRPEWVGANW